MVFVHCRRRENSRFGEHSSVLLEENYRRAELHVRTFAGALGLPHFHVFVLLNNVHAFSPQTCVTYTIIPDMLNLVFTGWV